MESESGILFVVFPMNTKEEKVNAMRRVFAVCMLAALVCGMAVAGGTKEPAAGSTGASAGTEAWLKAAALDKYAPAKQDWAAIEAAARKEGKVLVYANSSRIADVKATFEKKYPGITLEGSDLGGDDVLLKVKEEQKAGAYTADVWFSSSASGDVVGDLLPKQYLWPFVPEELLSVIPPEARNPLVVSRNGIRVLGYNSELNPGGSPVKNFWELTEPQWKGKIFIEDPLNDASTMGILTTIVSRKDEMAAAYKELYGKEPVLDSDTPDAGWLWLKKFARNKPVGEPGGDEVVQAFATPKMKDNLIGFTSYSKYRDVVKGKLVFEPCKGLKPIIGVQTATYLAIVNRAPHPNAAKLFIQYVLGEEGSKPWSVIGDYSPRTDLASPKGAIPYAELSKMVWSVNEAYVYKNITKVRDFWAINLLQ